MSSAVQESVQVFRREVIEPSKRVESDAQQARASFEGERDHSALVAAVVEELAGLFRSGMEHNVSMVDALVKQNKELAKEVKVLREQAKAKSLERVRDHDDDDPEDDSRSFGTHIREAIAAFRGR